MDKVLTDEQAEELEGRTKAAVGLSGALDYKQRLDDLEEAVSVLMGFVKAVLPADFERFMKKEFRLGEHPDRGVLRS